MATSVPKKNIDSKISKNNDNVLYIKSVSKHVLKNPRITEKSSYLMSKNIYVFDVYPGANKLQVSKAIQAQYNVKPEKVRMITIPSKKVVVRGKRGVKSGGKKAYVILKKTDKIEIV